MSSICLLRGRKVQNADDRLCAMIKQQITQMGYGVFFWIDTFPASSQKIDASEFVCSFADDFQWDNCEMLLLPDGSFFNGKTNATPFYRRMEALGGVLQAIKAKMQAIELYVGGNGGDSMDEFDLVRTDIESFPILMDHIFNRSRSDVFPAIHFVFI